MQRIVLAATTGALLLAGSACATKSETTAAPTTPAAASAAASATVSASPSMDYTADTKKVCDEVTKALEGKELEKFAEQLGEFIGYKEAKASAAAEKARVKAGENLKSAANVLRASTAAAKDPELKAAGEEASGKMALSAEDDAFFAKFNTEKDVDKALEPQMTVWFAPIVPFCP